MAASRGAKETSSDRDRLIAAILLVTCFAVYHASPVTQMYDARYLAAVSHSLLETGRFSIQHPIPGQDDDYRLRVRDGALYHWYPNAPAVLNLPLVFVFELFGFSVFDGDEFDRGVETGIFRIAAAATTAATVALGYLMARIWLTPGFSLGLTLLFAFGTQLYSSASRAYWSHSWGVLLLTSSLYLLLAPRFRTRPVAYVGAASALAWAFFCRPPYALSVVALTCLLLAKERRRFLPIFVGAGAAWAILFFVYSQGVYGQMLPPYFHGTGTLESGLDLARLVRPPREAALATLFSPGRGLFVFTPMYALTLVFAVGYWRRLACRRLALLGIAVIAAHWLLISGMHEWWAGGCYGPRTFTDVVPWFLVLSAMVLAAVRASAPSWSRPALAGWTVVLVLLASMSLFAHTRGAVSWATRFWGDWDLRWARAEVRPTLFYYERLVNWKYPQFMAGLIPVPPPEHFESWLCEGEEAIEQVRCRRRLRVELLGTPGSEWTARLSDGRVLSGRIGEDGSRVRRFRAPPSGEGSVTVVWDCGTVITKSFVCP